MKLAAWLASFIGGIAACYLLISMGILRAYGNEIPRDTTGSSLMGFWGRFIGTGSVEPSLDLPTYLSFISVLLTTVTVVLAALAIGVGVVAFFTYREIRNEAKTLIDRASEDVEAKLKKALSDEAIDARLKKIVTKNQTAGELEETFDPQDQEER